MKLSHTIDNNRSVPQALVLGPVRWDILYSTDTYMRIWVIFMKMSDYIVIADDLFLLIYNISITDEVDIISARMNRDVTSL